MDSAKHVAVFADVFGEARQGYHCLWRTRVGVVMGMSGPKGDGGMEGDGLGTGKDDGGGVWGRLGMGMG